MTILWHTTMSQRIFCYIQCTLKFCKKLHETLIKKIKKNYVTPNLVSSSKVMHNGYLVLLWCVLLGIIWICQFYVFVTFNWILALSLCNIHCILLFFFLGLLQVIWGCKRYQHIVEMSNSALNDTLVSFTW